MIEEAPLRFANGVFGVLTRPASAPRGPVVVLLNAGFIHRPGPFRLHVDLARALAADGFASARIDLPGTGDAPAPSNPDDVAVVAEVLDALGASCAADGFVVGGLCSAADLGWKVALADPRVRGFVMLDGIARKGVWFRVGQAKLLFARGARAVRSVLAHLWPSRAAAAPPDTRDWPQAGRERGEFERMVGRGVEIFALYTGGSPDYFTHPAQFGATFGPATADPRVHFAFWPDCDHMFMLKADRNRLIDSIRGWCNAKFAR